MSGYLVEITEGDQLALVLPLASDPTGGTFEARAQRLDTPPAASIGGVVAIVDSGSIQSTWSDGALGAGVWRIQIAGETDDHPFQTLVEVKVLVRARNTGPAA